MPRPQRSPDYLTWEVTDTLGTISVALTKAAHAEVGHVEIRTGPGYSNKHRLTLEEAKKLSKILDDLL